MDMGRFEAGPLHWACPGQGLLQASGALYQLAAILASWPRGLVFWCVSSCWVVTAAYIAGGLYGFVIVARRAVCVA